VRHDATWESNVNPAEESERRAGAVGAEKGAVDRAKCCNDTSPRRRCDKSTS
jgi:hypothetical protein